MSNNELCGVLPPVSTPPPWPYIMYYIICELITPVGLYHLALSFALYLYEYKYGRRCMRNFPRYTPVNANGRVGRGDGVFGKLA